MATHLNIGPAEHPLMTPQLNAVEPYPGKIVDAIEAEMHSPGFRYFRQFKTLSIIPDLLVHPVVLLRIQMLVGVTTLAGAMECPLHGAWHLCGKPVGDGIRFVRRGYRGIPPSELPFAIERQMPDPRARADPIGMP